MSDLTAIEQLLASGTDDWVPLVAFVRKVDSARAGDELRREVLAMVGEVLKQGWMSAGDLRESGFNAWPLSIAETLERIEREWTALNRPPELGEICWFSNTEKGDRQARMSSREKMNGK